MSWRSRHEDCFEQLRREHYHHRMLARRLSGASDPADRAARLASVADHLRRHVEAEQAVVHAVLGADPEACDLATRALRGQLMLSQQLAELGCALHDALRYEELASSYRAVMEHQLRLEEEELFPAASHALGRASA